MAVIASMQWRRHDLPGQDACRLERRDEGWGLEGMAIFRHEAGPAALGYVVRCDADWNTGYGAVCGFLGKRRVALVMKRGGEVWTVNDMPVREVEGLVDLDLGFTPATNLIALRRGAPGLGEARDLPAAWLDIDTGTLAPLPQTYERRGEDTFWYRAPSAGYEGLLRVSLDGFVRSYPGLWEEVARG